MSSLFARLFLFSAAAGLLYLPARMVYRRRRPGAQNGWAREVVLFLFVAFMGGLLALVFQPGNLNPAGGTPLQSALQRLSSGQGINWVPFFTIRRFFAFSTGTTFAVNIVANVLMFSPLGFGLPLLWKRWQKALRVIPAGLAFSLCVEGVQLFIGRSVDVDDVILNTLGVALGYLLYRVTRGLLPKLGGVAA